MPTTRKTTRTLKSKSNFGGSFGTLLALALVASSVRIATSQRSKKSYGTQCSFAITSEDLDGCDAPRQEFYDSFIQGCVESADAESCFTSEQERLEMNTVQPPSMINMTATGYHKIKAPTSLVKLLKDFWEANKEKKQPEYWEDGAIYVNHWESPAYVVDIDDEELEGGGKDLKKAIWDAAIDGVSKWTGGQAKLRPVSVYGIREYTEGAILSPHIDRHPLVSSGIVNVAQDVDEPWPLEVYDRSGKAVNITMEPGDMILYESHSLIHGRPFPLKGRYMANVFIHFEPIESWGEGKGKESEGDNPNVPPYILPGSPGEKAFLRDFPNGWSKDFSEGAQPDVHEFAASGDLESLKEAAEKDSRLLHWRDPNGWTPLHEAARSGQTEVVNYLVEKGADINAIDKGNTSPLRVAVEALGIDHTVVEYLMSLGAADTGDGEDEEGEEEVEDEF
mmetsp:Transcript_26417/g.72641  ORF Transcript_26417/g.72641 Transcript_26417/m.72641 type:complete len:449 (+) Transcript_26417:137-1483(+)|eukprot:CAMPEP_0172359392 /NCGR_PEP_ID=MMETSP1060-20121228/3598_1 /TAXON_ID=37318 /ORGANISM="Pseudo-nitzschia pungens, Strain cf. cingulata" /LENGTH=448 /DNA_ID=CAMNT_0013081025 /DNA_START=160 /DNA_END=1506 /DNA_ORIENTATION=-